MGEVRVAVCNPVLALGIFWLGCEETNVLYFLLSGQALELPDLVPHTDALLRPTSGSSGNQVSEAKPGRVNVGLGTLFLTSHTIDSLDVIGRHQCPSAKPV